MEEWRNEAKGRTQRAPRPGNPEQDPVRREGTADFTDVSIKGLGLSEPGRRSGLWSSVWSEACCSAGRCGTSPVCSESECG